MVLSWLLVLITAAGGALGTWYFATGHDVGDPRAGFGRTGAGGVSHPVYIALQVVLLPDQIEVHEVVRKHVLRREEILGWRVIQEPNSPPYIVFVPRDRNRRKVKVAQIFKGAKQTICWPYRVRSTKPRSPANRFASD